MNPFLIPPLEPFSENAIRELCTLGHIMHLVNIMNLCVVVQDLVFYAGLCNDLTLVPHTVQHLVLHMCLCNDLTLVPDIAQARIEHKVLHTRSKVHKFH